MGQSTMGKPSLNPCKINSLSYSLSNFTPSPHFAILLEMDKGHLGWAGVSFLLVVSCLGDVRSDAPCCNNLYKPGGIYRHRGGTLLGCSTLDI